MNEDTHIIPQNGVVSNLIDGFKHRFSLLAMPEEHGPGLSAAKTSSRGTPYQFHPGLFSLAWLVFSSYLVSFLMRLLNGGAVLLGASEFGYCYQAHQKGYLFNAPDAFYFLRSATGSSTGSLIEFFNN